jgi:hypothetical protein
VWKVESAWFIETAYSTTNGLCFDRGLYQP